MSIKVAILGCSGRMGRNLIQAAHEHEKIELIGGRVRQSSSFVDFDLGELAGIGKMGITTSTSIASLQAADVLIDFTSIESTFEHIAWCQKHNKALVIGTTGFDEEQTQQIVNAGDKMPVLLAPNTSVGYSNYWK